MKTKIKLSDKNKGFTIIEVLIVLAIAGLILLIVFLAVPALQRNTRNTGRKEDAGRISSAVNDYISNNNGALPGTTTALWCGTGGATPTPGAEGGIMTDAGTLNQYSNVTTCAITQGSVTFAIESGAVTTAAARTNELILDENATCSNATGLGTTQVVTVASTASTSPAVLLYDLETGSGAWNWSCLTVQ